VSQLPERPKLSSKARLRFDQKSGKHMLLYPEKGLLLNPTGTDIVQLCTGENSIAQIVTELSAKYTAVSAAQLEGEVLAFLSALSERGLLDEGAL
jgi:pyrroloquinoline quinone biosynthesis protein D